ncbi:unnamed protein product [Caenorhabditis angaria]|uniref:Branched-chain-amino-acid aminotransferase n=1 Tax=Caenorhabditis angaria TaxID=860376 RepID=A0A9P1IV30_9PELO|nr:unnamed protein product [Caenorhabditis angaria]
MQKNLFYSTISARFSLSSRREFNKTFYHKDLIVKKSPTSCLDQIPKDVGKLGFGQNFSDHMVDVVYTDDKGWGAPKIQPISDFRIHPAARALHYGVQLFEGMKAYHGVDGKIRLFRPEMNMLRMKRSAERACLPDFDVEEALKVIDSIVRLEHKFIPKSRNGALYVRPFMLSAEPTMKVAAGGEARWAVLTNPVGSYFKPNDKGVTLLADPGYVRSWKGGVGEFKMGCNYAPTIFVNKAAMKMGCDQVMWLSGENRLVTEAGAMNLFVFWKNEQGEDELITAPVSSGLLLPGVTRDSVIELAKEWNEFKVTERNFTMDELSRAIKEKRVHEFFVSGTAATVLPAQKIIHKDQEKGIDDVLHIDTTGSKFKLHERIFKTITGIQYGEIEREKWQRIVTI